MATTWEDIKCEVLLKCKRYCCHCERFCGNNIEVHHIKQRCDGGKDTMDNAIPLCFECHAIIGAYSAKHPKGNKYSAKELKRIRDEWYEKAEKLSRNPISLSENDMILLKNFKDNFTDIMEYIIDTDFSSQLVDASLPDIIEDLIKQWSKKRYIFSNKQIEEMKQSIVESLGELLIYLSPTYMRLRDDSGSYLIYRNQSWEEVCRLRDELRPNSYRIRCDIKRKLDALYTIES